MKKAIILVLTNFLIITLILLGKPVKAQTTEITPQYAMDIFYRQTCYLFNNYSTTPNYENGYLDKIVIGYEDTKNGWYYKLGHNMADEIYAIDDEYWDNNECWFYIPFNNMLSDYMELAIDASTTVQHEIYVYYTDNTYDYVDTNQEYTSPLILTISSQNLGKNVKYLAWSCKPIDYYVSFKALTSQNAYEYGYSEGFYIGRNEGFNEGRNVSVENAYNEGYQNGLNDGATTQYVAVQYYKQISHFTTSQNINQSQNNISYQVSGNDVLLITIDTTSQLTYGAITNPETNNLLIDEHKYLIGYTLFNKGGTNIACALKINYDSVNQAIATNKNERPIATIYINPIQQYKYIQLVIYKTDESPLGINDFIEIGNIFIIDLSEMYGIGNEPTTEQCEEIFTSYYYPKSDGELLNINYLDGYANGQGVGYDNGISYQATKQLTADGWLKNIFTGIGALLNINILPGVSIGLIVGIPFIITLAYFVIRAFRGGGGA